MKKLICLLILANSGFIMAQNKTVVTPNGEKVDINTTKGTLSSPKPIIAVTGGTDKLVGGDATIEIVPGTTGQILVTDKNNDVKWGTIADVKGLLVNQGTGFINAGIIPFTNGIDYQRFATNSITVTGPSTIIVRVTLYSMTTQSNERALGIFRIVKGDGGLIGDTAISPFYLESKDYVGGNNVPVSASVSNEVPNVTTLYGTLDAPTAGTYNFHIEGLVLGFSNYNDNALKPTGKVKVGFIGIFNPYYSYEVYNK